MKKSGSELFLLASTASWYSSNCMRCVGISENSISFGGNEIGDHYEEDYLPVCPLVSLGN